jgi:hypothetical protein
MEGARHQLRLRGIEETETGPDELRESRAEHETWKVWPKLRFGGGVREGAA